MPKTSNEGPSYAGLTDVSPPETATPEWVPADSDEAKAALAADEPAADVSRETKADEKSDEKAERKPAARKTGKS